MKEIFEHTAHLARLGPYESSQEEKLTKEFERILELFDILKEIPPEKTRWEVSAGDLKNVCRQDSAQAFENTKTIIENFPGKEGSLIKVPKVIE